MLIINSIITDKERELLYNKVCEAFDSGEMPEYHEAGTYNRFAKLQITDLKCIDLKTLRKRISTMFNLDEYTLRDPNFGDFISIIKNGGNIQAHIDNYPGYDHFRVNLVLQKPIDSGYTVIDGVEYEVDECDCWGFRPDLKWHSTTPVIGDKDRVSISFGYLKNKNMLIDKYVNIDEHDFSSIIYDNETDTILKYVEYSKELQNKYLVKSDVETPINYTKVPSLQCLTGDHHCYHSLTSIYCYPKRLPSIYYAVALDGFGNMTGGKTFKFEGNVVTTIEEHSHNSVGILWDAIGTIYFNYPNTPNNGKAGTLMALASYGTPNEKMIEAMERYYNKEWFIVPVSMEIFRVNMDQFKLDFNIKIETEVDKLTLAASLQEFTNRKLLSIFKPLKEFTDFVFFSGGVAHNLVSIKYLEDTLGITIFTGFAQGDEGVSLGYALYNNYILNNKEYKPLGYRKPYSEIRPEPMLPYVDIVNDLINNGIVAIYNGSPEIGNRALGHRSFLANPGSKDIKQRLDVLKQRESFRPYGIMILKEDTTQWFTTDIESPYMNKLGTPSKLFIDKFPSLVHIDNTVRVQTITYDLYPEIYLLLTNMKEQLGFAVLINTSLNIDTPMLYKGHSSKVLDMVDNELIKSCYIHGKRFSKQLHRL